MTPMLPTSGAMAGGRTPRDASTTMGRSEEARTAASASETQATRRAVSRSGTMIASDLCGRHLRSRSRAMASELVASQTR